MGQLKETLEALKAVQTIAVALKESMADGTIDWKDMPKLLPVIKDLKNAVEGAKLIPEEIKGMTTDDIDVLFGAVADIVAVIVEVISKQ